MTSKDIEADGSALSTNNEQVATENLAEAALNYHRFPTPGKLEISATKKMVNQRDLALAYSPGVAVALSLIHISEPTRPY